jgi:hypothetical protein
MARPGLPTHRKLRRLVHMLSIPVPYVIDHLECVWSVAYECGDPLLGDMVDVELAAQWPGERGKLCEALVACGFVDADADGRYSVHDLFDHAPEYVQRRAEREAARKLKGESIASLRAQAGRKGGFASVAARQADMKQTEANGSNCPTLASTKEANGEQTEATDGQSQANGATPRTPHPKGRRFSS